MIEKICTKCGAKWLFGNDNHNECPECGGELRKKTNADIVRNMTDEELAEWFDLNFPCLRHEGCLAEKCCNDTINCKKAWLKWLKQETD